MDKTVQSYLNEYISLIGKGKFVLLGGNTFLDGANPKLDMIVEAINKYTTTDGVTAEGIFESRIKNKAEVEIKKPDGTIEVAKGSATDAQYAAFVAEWKGIQKNLVEALIAQFDIVEKAKGAAPAGAPGLFGGVTVADLTVGLSPLKKAGDVAAVVAVMPVDDVNIIMDYISNKLKKAEMNYENFLKVKDIKDISEIVLPLVKADPSLKAPIVKNLNTLGRKLYEFIGELNSDATLKTTYPALNDATHFSDIVKKANTLGRKSYETIGELP
jgi:hypothetical protein